MNAQADRNILCPRMLTVQNDTVKTMARTSFGPWKLVLDMGSSSHCGLIIALGPEADGDNLWISFRSSIE